VEKGLTGLCITFRKTVHLLVFSAFCLLSACATSQDVDIVRYDINRLQRENLELKNEINSLHEKTKGIAKEESFNVVRASQAELQTVLSNLSRDIQNLSGRFDESKFHTEKTLKNTTTEIDIIKLQITTLEGQLKDIKIKLDTLESQVQKQKETAKEQKKEGIDLSKKEEPSGEDAVQGAKAKYEAAYAIFENKKYREAREQFESFIKEFPKNELTDNAYFWIAETYYREKDFEGAILAYETLLKKYPDSKKVPNALYKQAISFIEIGDKKTGKVLLEQVIERYPQSTESKLAQKKLTDFNEKPNKKK
jgi:tol-pal system protein YbgF